MTDAPDIRHNGAPLFPKAVRLASPAPVGHKSKRTRTLDAFEAMEARRKGKIGVDDDEYQPFGGDEEDDEC